MHFVGRKDSNSHHCQSPQWAIWIPRSTPSGKCCKHEWRAWVAAKTPIAWTSLMVLTSRHSSSPPAQWHQPVLPWHTCSVSTCWKGKLERVWHVDACLRGQENNFLCSERSCRTDCFYAVKVPRLPVVLIARFLRIRWSFPWRWVSAEDSVQSIIYVVDDLLLILSSKDWAGSYKHDSCPLPNTLRSRYCTRIGGIRLFNEVWYGSPNWKRTRNKRYTGQPSNLAHANA